MVTKNKGNQMKIINIKDHMFRKGEYIVGEESTGSHACYFLYGALEPGEERKMTPGKGHEEIICLMEGTVEIKADDFNLTLNKGQCLHLSGDEHVEFRAMDGVVIYVIAGGHSEGSSHHH